MASAPPATSGPIECPIGGCNCQLGWSLDGHVAESVRQMGGLEAGTPLQTFFAKVATARADLAARQVSVIHDRFLLKLAIRSLIWLILAATIVYLFPEQTWVWLLAGAFIVLGAAVAIWAKVMHWKVKRMVRPNIE